MKSKGTRREQYPETQRFSEFSRWMRDNPRLNSIDGFTTSNIDWACHNFLKHTFKIVEEKRFFSKRSVGARPISRGQREIMRILHDALSLYDKSQTMIKYKGTHLLEFEYESPTDGRILLNKKPITASTLTAFLGDELPDEWYVSIYDQKGMSGIEEMNLRYSEPYDFDIKRSNLIYNETGLDKEKIMTKIRPLP